MLFAATPTARAQTRDSATVTPGEEHRAGALKRAIFGNGWRDQWTTPVTAPVFDPAKYNGGLKFDKRGGGNQTITVHFVEDNGWQKYIFRSVDKYPEQGMPPELKGTLLGSIIADEVNTLLPAAPLLVPPLLDAIGVLQVKPSLYVMANSPRLGAIRDTVAGMLGTVELRPSEAPNKQPGFAGARVIEGSEDFLEKFAASHGQWMDEREFLAVRLIDFLINDADRAPDNVDFARFGEEGAYTWRPLPRDRDWAFMDASGPWNALVIRRVYPKLVPFSERYPLDALTNKTDYLDRRLLQRLTANDFREVSLRVQRAITDSVIAQVVAQLPPEWRAQTNAAARITRVLRARRDAMPAAAMTFYRGLAKEVDVHATNVADRIVVDRHDDGTVSVTVTEPARRLDAAAAQRVRLDGRVETLSDGTIADTPYYTRTFLPGETEEVRVYADSGNDVVIVRGASSSPIIVRVIGGGGDDVLSDSAGGGKTFLYDSEGNNRFETGGGTHVDQRAWKALKPPFGFTLNNPYRPDWGHDFGWGPVVDFNTGAGLVLGVGPSYTDYGFRRLPYHWQASASFLVGTENGRVGVEGQLDHRAENSPRSFRVGALASQLEATRFFGYGNNTSDAGRAQTLVEQSALSLQPSLVWDIGWRARENQDSLRTMRSVHLGLRPLVGEFRVGPVASWFKPEADAGSRLLTSGALGAKNFGVGGATVGLTLDRTDDTAIPTMGWRLGAEGGAYPLVSGSAGAFGTASGSGSFYVPLGHGGGPHLAFRAGADWATGDYPAQFSAALGGRSSLRGYEFRRFAGDADVYGGTELRVPVGTVNFVVRSQVGVFGLADVGRVWFDGDSSGGWHPGVGGGFWLAAFGHSVSVAYAHGDSHRFYIKSGMSY